MQPVLSWIIVVFKSDPRSLEINNSAASSTARPCHLESYHQWLGTGSILLSSVNDDFPCGLKVTVASSDITPSYSSCLSRDRASQVAQWVQIPLAIAGDAGDTGSIPGLGKSPGGGHRNPILCPCLENPTDRGAWWATAHGVAKSRTQLKRLSAHTHAVSKEAGAREGFYCFLIRENSQFQKLYSEFHFFHLPKLDHIPPHSPITLQVKLFFFFLLPKENQVVLVRERGNVYSSATNGTRPSLI